MSDGWSARRIPIVLDPLPGEALDSYLGAYARRLRVTEAQLLSHLGLPGGRTSALVVRLTPAESEALGRGCGLAPETLREMTLEPYDGLAVSLATHRRGVARWAGWRYSGSRTRFCPLCLLHDDGRGPLVWRFPWAFACAVHAVMLVDFCPSCGCYPAPWNVRRLGPRRSASCTRGHGPAQCGADLTNAEMVALPPEGRVLAAHRHISRLLGADGGQRSAAMAELRELNALARRAVRGLHTALAQAPPVVSAVVAECGGRLPKLVAEDVGDDAHNVALGAALALIAHGQGPERGAVFGWMVDADRAQFRGGPGIGVFASGWRPGGQGLVERVLGHLDPSTNLHTRLRYATATARPRWPELTAEQIRMRARMVPGMLWPSWAMRLLPVSAARDEESDPRGGLFRRGCAGFMLLPGGPAQLNFERALPLLGPGLVGRRRRTGVDGPRNAVERRIYEHTDLTPLAATLAELAYALDARGAPVDYARRRSLFTWSTVRLDPTAFRRMGIQLGWDRTGPREALLTWYLLMLLTGEHHPPPPRARRPFPAHTTRLRFRAPVAVRSFLDREAERILEEHKIGEPVTWEPPASWAPSTAWPGVDPEQADKDGFSQLMARSETAGPVAAELGWTREHVRLYCEISGCGLAPLSANGKPIAPEREQVLAAENLRDLYEGQLLPLNAIAQRAGCNTVTVRALLEIDGVAARGRFRRPLPPEGIDRAWLEREYVQRRRSMAELAAERGVGIYYLTKLATGWEIPIRGVNGGYSGLGHLHLDFQPSAALDTVASGPTALDRLAFLTRLPGHRSFAAAGRAIYEGHGDLLRHRLRQIESAVGFEVIDRQTTPLAPTERGAALLAEAALVLKAAGPGWTDAACAPAPAPAGTWSRRVRMEREANGSCGLGCAAHPGHVYTLCFGTATVVRARDYLPGDPARDYPVTHYVGFAGKLPGRRIRGHVGLATRFVAQIQPGDVAVEAAVMLEGRCPVCAESLWYYAESPTYPGWTAEQVPQMVTWPRPPGRPPRLLTPSAVPD